MLKGICGYMSKRVKSQVEEVAANYIYMYIKLYIYYCCHRTCVSMGERSRFMGASAKNQMISNFKNTIWGWKRLMGRKFEDPIIQKEISTLPYKVIAGPDGYPVVSVSYC